MQHLSPQSPHTHVPPGDQGALGLCRDDERVHQLAGLSVNQVDLEKGGPGGEAKHSGSWVEGGISRWYRVEVCRELWEDGQGRYCRPPTLMSLRPCVTGRKLSRSSVRAPATRTNEVGETCGEKNGIQGTGFSNSSRGRGGIIALLFIDAAWRVVPNPPSLTGPIFSSLPSRYPTHLQLIRVRRVTRNSARGLSPPDDH